jgi:hypothetical protein
MTMLEFHPLASLFPLVEGYEFAGLVDGRTGCTNPVVLFEGAVLDGRNRLRAGRLAGSWGQKKMYRDRGTFHLRMPKSSPA